MIYFSLSDITVELNSIVRANDIFTNTTNINTLDTRVTNEIARVDGDIATLNQELGDTNNDVAALDTRITTLEANTYFAYSQIENYVVPGDTYSEVNRLTETLPLDGTYEFKVSLVYNLNSTTDSAFVRYSIDGGSTWLEFSREPKDKTDNTAVTYSFYKDMTANDVVDFVLEARKENASNTLNIVENNLVIDKK